MKSQSDQLSCITTIKNCTMNAIRKKKAQTQKNRGNDMEKEP
jgi:hypothetical protein